MAFCFMLTLQCIYCMVIYIHIGTVYSALFPQSFEKTKMVRHTLMTGVWVRIPPMFYACIDLFASWLGKTLSIQCVSHFGVKLKKTKKQVNSLSRCCTSVFKNATFSTVFFFGVNITTLFKLYVNGFLLTSFSTPPFSIPFLWATLCMDFCAW